MALSGFHMILSGVGGAVGVAPCASMPTVRSPRCFVALPRLLPSRRLCSLVCVCVFFSSFYFVCCAGVRGVVSFIYGPDLLFVFCLYYSLLVPSLPSRYDWSIMFCFSASVSAFSCFFYHLVVVRVLFLLVIPGTLFHAYVL